MSVWVRVLSKTSFEKTASVLTLIDSPNHWISFANYVLYFPIVFSIMMMVEL